MIYSISMRASRLIVQPTISIVTCSDNQCSHSSKHEAVYSNCGKGWFAAALPHNALGTDIKLMKIRLYKGSVIMNQQNQLTMPNIDWYTLFGKNIMYICIIVHSPMICMYLSFCTC